MIDCGRQTCETNQRDKTSEIDSILQSIIEYFIEYHVNIIARKLHPSNHAIPISTPPPVLTGVRTRWHGRLHGRLRLRSSFHAIHKMTHFNASPGPSTFPGCLSCHSDGMLYPKLATVCWCPLSELQIENQSNGQLAQRKRRQTEKKAHSQSLPPVRLHITVISFRQVNRPQDITAERNLSNRQVAQRKRRQNEKSRRETRTNRHLQVCNRIPFCCIVQQLKRCQHKTPDRSLTNRQVGQRKRRENEKRRCSQFNEDLDQKEKDTSQDDVSAHSQVCPLFVLCLRNLDCHFTALFSFRPMSF